MTTLNIEGFAVTLERCGKDDEWSLSATHNGHPWTMTHNQDKELNGLTALQVLEFILEDFA